ncbi:helix-turn-helix domain-containing protein [Kitasatospora sp. NPDC001261]|uniref:helix-turn-helix domain-containing protein n=1 Tax=Kitasatospora sp. NPDC001261 TaxID=3364012 RepID=UPI00368307C4
MAQRDDHEQIDLQERARRVQEILADPETARLTTRTHLAGLTLRVVDGEKASRERARVIRQAYAGGGWTQADLADAAEISQPAVSQIINAPEKDFQEPDA